MPVKLVTNWRATDVIPPRPQMPTPEDQDRSEKQLLRWRMLNHKFDEDAAEFFQDAFGEDEAAGMGMPDTTLAPLPAQTAQLTTPGLYQTAPQMQGAEGDAGDRMADPQTGAVAQCGYWARMQHVMYHAVGIGVYGLRISAVNRGTDAAPNIVPTLRSVQPHNVACWFNVEDPMNPIRVAELRLRSLVNPGTGRTIRHGWFWDVFDISDPTNPTFEILNATDPKDKVDYAQTFLGKTFLGNDYGWRDPEGKPFIPYAWYHPKNSGDFWHEYRPALRTGTLRAVANWTVTGHSALWAQGNHNLVGGVPPGAVPSNMKPGQGLVEDADFAPISHLRVRPGMTTYLPVDDEKQLQVFSLTTGVNLQQSAAYSNLYNMVLATVDGINPSDATRRSANPTSGAALAISQTDKRAFANSVQPQFEKADKQALRILAWVMSVATGQEYQAEGWSLTYAPIPLTPTEQKDNRDQLEWEGDKGQRSPVDVHIALNPGMTREQAINAIVQVRVDEATIAKRVDEELSKLGGDPPAGTGTGNGGEDIQRQALNGAQVTAMQGIVVAAAEGIIPRDTAVAIIRAAFPNIPPEEADRILGPIGQGFTAPKPEPPVIPGAPPPRNEPPEDPPENGEED